MSQESWVEKYRPTVWSDIQGNNSDIDDLKDWCRNFTPGDKPQLLVGTQGTGKTSTANVIANKMGWPMNQTNASDKRSSEDIARLAASIYTTPPDAEFQLVLIDEIDSQSSRTNKRPLYDALDSPNNPVIITANDEYDIPQGIKSRCKIREFKLSKASKAAKLKDIAEAEGIRDEMSDADLEDLSQRADLRSAIQDMQTWAKQDIPPGQDERDVEIGEFEVMDNIMRGVKESGQVSPPDLVMWLDENLRKEFRGVEALTAYDSLSRADKWLSRAQQEDYRFWKYAGELAEQTATQRVTEPYDGWMDKDFPEWFRHKQPNAHGEKPEARLYRKLKDWEGGSFQFAGDYTHFLNVVLPILEDRPLDERRQMVLELSLDDGEMEALGVSPQRYKKWAQSDVPEDRQQNSAELQTTDVLDY